MKVVPRVTLQEFLDCCREWEQSRNPTAGLVACDQLLAEGAKGRLLAAALRYKAVFLLMSSQGWVLEAVGYLKEALDASQSYPSDQPAILVTLVGAYAMFGSCEYARQYADRYFDLCQAYAEPEVRRFAAKIWFNLAYAYETAGEVPLAAEAYRRSYEEALASLEQFNPGRPAHNLVQVYLDLGRTEDAVLMLETSRNHLDETRDGSFMKNQEARCLLALGRLQEATGACENALAHPSCTDRVRAEVLLTMAALHQAEGRVQEATLCADQAQEIAARLPHPRLLRKIGGFQQSLLNRKEVPET